MRDTIFAGPLHGEQRPSIGDAGVGFQVDSFNQLVAPFGVTLASSPTDGTGRTVSGFVAHPLTAGINTLGVDYQLPFTISSPAVDLTIGSGQDNILAVWEVPEPSSLSVLVVASLALFTCLRNRRWLTLFR